MPMSNFCMYELIYSFIEIRIYTIEYARTITMQWKGGNKKCGRVELDREPKLEPRLLFIWYTVL